MGTEGSSHTYSEIFVHFNWHCLKDRNLIVPRLEPALQTEIEQYCRKTKGAHFKGIGGTTNHVHLVVQLEPYVTISDFIGKVKGACSHEMNKRFGRDTIAWQRGYGVVSFAGRDLPGVLKYVQFQKEHHQAGTTREALEKYGDWEEESEQA